MNLSVTKYLFLASILLLAGCSSHRKDSSIEDLAVIEKDADYLAFIAASDKEEYQEAYRFTQNLTTKYPRNGSAWNSMGYAAECLLKFSDAQGHYKKAVKV